MLRGSSPIQLSQLDITPALQASALEQKAAATLAAGIDQGIKNFESKKEEKKQKEMTVSLLKQYMPGYDDDAYKALAGDKDLRNNFFDFVGAQSKAQAERDAAAIEANQLSPRIEAEIFDTNIKPKIGNVAEARENLERADEGINLLNQGLETGFGESIKLDLKKFANNFLGADFDVADQEVFRSQIEPLMQQYIQNTKGSISDSEMRLFQSWSAGLSNTAESNLRILKAVKNAADRQLKVNNYYSQLLTQTSDVRLINLKLEEFINKEASENPIFESEAANNKQSSSPSPVISKLIDTQEAFDELPSGTRYRETEGGPIFVKP